MSKKDYELIAGAIRNTIKNMESDQDAVAVYQVARDLAQELARDNARFNADKFMSAISQKS